MMEPRLPGIWYASNRQTAFYLVPDGACATTLYKQLFQGVKRRRTTEGLAVENACVLITPDGAAFRPVTWQAKRLGAWRRDFMESTQAQGIVTARFRGRRLIVSDGRRYWFRDLVVERL